MQSRRPKRGRKRASSTPTLERFGRDLTALARAGRLGPIVGREREIGAIIEILLRKTKRDPMLLGPAGVGQDCDRRGARNQARVG